MENRNYAVDLLRFIAAFWVALFHFNEPIHYIDNWYRSIVKLGYLGIPIFFVISGYCILLAASRSENAMAFITRRLFRIMPAYWFSIIVVLIVIVIQKLLIGYNSVAAIPKDLAGIAGSVTLLTYPFSTIPTLNWVYWSLTYELFFYIIITFSILLPKQFKLHFLIFISLLACVIPISPPGPLFFLYHWPTFALGLGIYLIYNNDESKHTLFGILIFTISLISISKNFLLSGQIAYCAAAVIVTSLIMLSHHIKLKNNMLSKLGDYSYAVYLIHVPIGIYLIGLINLPNIQTNIFLNIGFNLLTYLIISILSVLIFRYIEYPAIQLGKRFSKTYIINKKVAKQQTFIKN